MPYKERMRDTALAEIEACYALGWTDGLPVVPPTPERVEAMLGAWAPRRAEAIATLLPSGGVATVEKIAANAVMAGCLPAYLPVVIGAVQAVAQPAFGLEAVLTTVHSCSPMLLVSGPVAAERGGVHEAVRSSRAQSRSDRTPTDRSIASAASRQVSSR